MTENTKIRENELVPPSLWGRDHYSTMAYIETKLVDRDEYSVRFDPHMRQKRRHFRVLLEALGRAPSLGAHPMSPEHGTRLSDGTYLPWHDDWDCVCDLWAAGLFEGDYCDFDVGAKLKLTSFGHRVAATIREHKANGGTFSTCGPAVLLVLDAR